MLTYMAKESGSSSWLTVLPIQEHGFYLHKDLYTIWIVIYHLIHAIVELLYKFFS